MYTVFRNVFSLVFYGLLDKLFYLLFFAFIARRLSPVDFASYNLFLTFLFLGSMLATLATEHVLTREIAKNRSHADRYFFHGLFLTIFCASLVWALMIGLMHLLEYNSHLIHTMYWGGGIFLFAGISQIAAAVLKGYERMDIFATIGVIHSILSVVSGTIAVALGGALFSLVIILLVMEGMKALALFFIVHRFFIPFSVSLQSELLTTLIIKSIPFALLITYGVLNRRIDLLFMGWLRPMQEVALYSAAAKLIDFLSIFSTSLLGALFPAFSYRVAESQDTCRPLYEDSVALFAILGFSASAGLLVLARPILELLFGMPYGAASSALALLSMAFFFTVLSGPVGVLSLAAEQHVFQFVIICFLVLGCNMACNMLLIPLYGCSGAAMATLIAAIAGFAGQMYLAKNMFGCFPRLHHHILRPFIATLVMLALIVPLDNLPVLLRVLLGACAYLLALLSLGELKEARYCQLKSKLSKFIYSKTGIP